MFLKCTNTTSEHDYGVLFIRDGRETLLSQYAFFSFQVQKQGKINKTCMKHCQRVRTRIGTVIGHLGKVFMVCSLGFCLS